MNIRNIFKKQAVKLTALVLSLSLIGGGTVFALAERFSDDSPAKNESSATDAANTEDTSIKDEISSVLDSFNADKQETVYVIANADGSVKKVIVSELVKNPDKKDKLEDKSDLQNIENIKNDNGYTADGNSYIWDAKGDDVYYQGTTDKQLPVDLSLNFTLDGKSVSPKELAGKSGKLKITFNYTNNEAKTVKIDGKDETIYVPFLMLSGLVLDNDKCSNIEVSNGKVISDGNRSIAVGFALPGMQNNLDIDKNDLELPETVELTADVKDFELTTTLTLAASDFLKNINTEKLDSIDDLTDSLDTLNDSAKQLLDGTSSLYDGTAQLLSKSNDLVNGVQALVIGAQTLADGADSLSAGAGKANSGAGDLSDGAAKLSSGLDTLYAGLKTLNQNSDSLRAGSKQVFESLLSTANTQLAAAGVKADKLTIDNYSKVLSGVLSSLDENAVKTLAENTAKKTVTDKVTANEPTIKAGVESAVREKVKAGVLSTLGMTVEQYDKALAAGAVSDAQKAQIEGAIEQQMNTADIQSQIKAATEQQKQKLIDDNMKSDEVQSQIKAAIEKAKNGASSIKSLKEQLDSYNKFYKGLDEYTKGVDKAYSGAGELSSGSKTLCGGAKQLQSGTKDLSDGAKQLQSGAKELLAGVLKLNDGTAALIDGEKQLNDGAMSLNNGMQKFYDEGISKLVGKIKGLNFGKLATRIRATADVADDYSSFGGNADGMSSSTKFIYRTDSISK